MLLPQLRHHHLPFALGRAGSSSGRNLWVSGLSSTTRATDLKNLFSKYGKVCTAHLSPHNFGWVENNLEFISSGFSFLVLKKKVKQAALPFP
jgi:RNA recognition motif-containing protein